MLKVEKYTATVKKSFKRIDYKLLTAIFFTLFIPTLYTTTRIFFIGDMPNTWSVSVAGNLQWINVLFEVLEESILLPLFFSLRRIVNSESDERNKKISFQLIAISVIYLITIIIFIICTKPMMEGLGVKVINDTSIKFIRIEFITRFFVMLSKFGLMMLIAKDSWKSIFGLLIMSTVLNILLDLFIASDNKMSLNKGVLWIGYDQLISSGLMSLLYLGFIYKLYNFRANHLIPRFYFDKQSLKQNVYSGLESFVRNAFFIWFVIKTINKLDDGNSSGDFWVMNSYIWGWLLIPILALSQYLNRDQALNNEKIKLSERLTAPFIMIGIIILIWAATIPTYKPFIHHVLNNKNYELVGDLALISLGFYITMALNDPIDKILYGDGKAQYILLQSLITNVVVYIPYYYLTNSMTIYDVAIMMGTAIAVDSFITFIMFFVWTRKKIKNN